MGRVALAGRASATVQVYRFGPQKNSRDSFSTVPERCRLAAPINFATGLVSQAFACVQADVTLLPSLPVICDREKAVPDAVAVHHLMASLVSLVGRLPFCNAVIEWLGAMAGG